MKQKILLALLGLICFSLTQNHRAFAQVNITVNPPTPPPTPNNTASFPVSIGAAVLPQGIGFTTPPFQEIFWIFGDGDFYRDPIPYGPNAPYNSSSHTKTYYTGVAAGTNYTVEALVKDRKTDNPPPPARIFTGYNPNNSFDLLFVTGTPPGGDDFIDYAYSNSVFNFAGGSPPKKVGLTNSHLFTPSTGNAYYFIEDLAQTVFVLGFSPRNTGKLLLFYKDGDGVTAIDDFDNTYASFKPRYGSATLAGSVSQNTNLANYEIGAGPFEYNKTLEYDITASDLGIDFMQPVEGLRLFYRLTANDIDEQLQGGYPFMVMLTRYESSWNGTIGQQNFSSGDNAFVSNYVDAGTGQIGATDLYFVDADTIHLKGGEPKDPNTLKVTSICKCGENDYLVSFELIYCNESNVETAGANILVRDNNGLFQCFRLAQTEPFACSEPPTAGAVLSEWDSRATRCGSADYEGWDLRYYATTCTLAIDANTSIGLENCAKFRFTARTDAVGLNSLLSEGTLTACVELHEVACDRVCCGSTRLDISTFTNPVDSTHPLLLYRNYQDWLIWEGRNNACAIGACTPCCTTILCCLIEWVGLHPLMGALIVVAVLILAYYLFTRRKRFS